MLVIVYYLRPSAYLLDPQVSSISAGAAIALSIATLVVGWVVYDSLCKTRLVAMGWKFALLGFVLITLVAFGLSHVFSARAAYLHVGALIGTMMVGNVYYVIIPSQKALVAAAVSGGTPDAALGMNALRRSRHNNYLTLPVLFIMLSTHFPSTHGHPHSWFVLSCLIFIGVAVRHYFNIRKQNPKSIWILPASALGMVALAVYTAPASTASTSMAPLGPVAFSKVREIIAGRCTQCHSVTPSDDIFKAPPNGIVFDTPEQIRGMSERIKVRAVELKTMPLINKTGMTEEERAILGAWVNSGATID
jgi:uncharacterized membrane protein